MLPAVGVSPTRNPQSSAANLKRPSGSATVGRAHVGVKLFAFSDSRMLEPIDKCGKSDNDTHMEWHGNIARFNVGGKWYLSGAMFSRKPPFIMGGFIQEHTPDIELLDDDEEVFTDEERKACEAAIMRFFEEGYIVREGQFQDYCMMCVLDGEKYPVLGAYAGMPRNPKSPEEVWRFYHAPPDDDGYIDE